MLPYELAVDFSLNRIVRDRPTHDSYPGAVVVMGSPGQPELILTTDEIKLRIERNERYQNSELIKERALN